MYHPLDPGPGIGAVARWMMSKELGKEFIRQLFTKQDVAYSRNNKQILDWVARGRYAIALAFRTGQAADMIEKGIRLELMPPDSLKEAPATSLGAAGVVSVINRAPHPNAVKVYLNYLLSREGQYASSKAAEVASRRLDVPTDHLPLGVYPVKPGMKVLNAHGEESIHIRTETAEFVKLLLK
jgi:iron(III) transport system substrate-binding protein